MKLYNPIVNGISITVEGRIFNVDSTMEFENGEEVKEMYPFLVDISEPKYSPDQYPYKESMSFRKIKRSIKRIFYVLEQSILRLHNR